MKQTIWAPIAGVALSLALLCSCCQSGSEPNGGSTNQTEEQTNEFINAKGLNVLGAVAEYNVNPEGQFLTTHATEKGGYFSYEEAKSLSMPAGYHLPSRHEWVAVIGSDYQQKNVVWTFFNKDGHYEDVAVDVCIPGQTDLMSCVQDVQQVSAEKATYMLRYKDNDTYRSAWRYSWTDDMPSAAGKGLKIEAVTVTKKVTMQEVNKEFFEANKSHVKTIYLPAAGWDYNKDGSGDGKDRGNMGFYWTASNDGVDASTTARNLMFTPRSVNVFFNAKEQRYPVRLFGSIK